MNRPTKLMIIENEAELSLLLANISAKNMALDECLVVTTSVTLRLKLLASNIASPSTTELLGVEAHFEGNDGLNALMAKFEHAFASFINNDEFGLRECYRVALQYRLQYVFSHLIYMTQLYLAAIEKFPSLSTIMSFGPSPVRRSELLEPQESFLHELALLVARLKNIQVTILAKGSPDHGSNGCHTSFVPVFALRSILRRLMGMVLKNNAKRMIVLTSVVNKMDVIATGLQQENPDWTLCYLRNFFIGNKSTTLKEELKALTLQTAMLLFALLGKKFRIPGRAIAFDYVVDFQCLAPKPNNQAAFLAEYVKLSSALTKPDHLVFHNIDFSSLIQTKLNEGILPALLDLRAKIALLSWFDQRANDKFYISPHSHDLAFALGELCQLKKSKDALLISHGSHPTPSRSYLDKEYKRHGEVLIDARFPWVAYQTPLAQAYCQHYRTPSQGLITGPLCWGLPVKRDVGIRQRLGLPLDKKLIIHAGTQKGRASHYFLRYETADEYIDGLKDLIAAVQDNDDVILLIKFRDGETLDMDSLQAILPKANNVFYNKNDSFLQLLHEASLVVSFSSTTLEESLQYNVPVLQYGGRGRFPFINCSDFSQDRKFQRHAVSFAGQAADLPVLIKQILREFDQKPLSENELSDYVYPQEKRQKISDLMSR